MERVETGKDQLLANLFSLLICLSVITAFFQGERSVPFRPINDISASIPEQVIDYSVKQNHCHIHGLKLETKKVPVIYGLLTAGSLPPENVAEKSFPFGQTWVAGGCCLSLPTEAIVSQCPRCCELQAEWMRGKTAGTFQPVTGEIQVIKAELLRTKVSTDPDWSFEDDQNWLELLDPISPEPSIPY